MSPHWINKSYSTYEATGRLQDALGCYECLCVSQGSEEVYKDQNLSQSSLNKYRVEAAWKLGQWEQLEGFLKKGPKEPSWGQGVGQILLWVRARDLNAYHTSLSNLCTQQIISLSAASMEKWAYQRAYPCIIRKLSIQRPTNPGLNTCNNKSKSPRFVTVGKEINHKGIN
ncbi:hypothetical protein Pmani_007099 [Petrolisthes manimaculis]|uniref:Uncharacterized protein n=1 Tax=Petrolisthes manimaculis TaxID=1843537 RepID=A0AAE1QB98_9EUCA|nr:hypothetical protein Pmani_007099 [Petrolisthes manimaculis]